MTTLTAEQTLDMLGDLAAGAIDDVFTQDELQRFFDRAEGDYATAVYYGWRQILANSAAWVNYQVAQTKVNRGDAFDHIKAMLQFWQEESRTAANQLAVLGANPIPTKWKEKPADDPCYRRGRYAPYPRWR